MAFNCNGIGCNTPGDCESCRQTNCEKTYNCDICGEKLEDEYWQIDGNDYCENCLTENYQRTIL